MVGAQMANAAPALLVCEVIRAFPKVTWIAGEITQLGEGLCAQNVRDCGCEPSEHACAFAWDTHGSSITERSPFLAAGASHTFTLRFKQGYVSQALPLLSRSLCDLKPVQGDSPKTALVVASNFFAPLVKPSLFFALIDPDKQELSESLQDELRTANALVLPASGDDANSDAPPAPLWLKVPPKLLQERPSVLLRQGEPLPRPLASLIHQMLDDPPSIAI